MSNSTRLKNEDEPNSVISNWLRKVDTIEFLILWESINNENFKPIDFEGYKSKPGENAFSISTKKWRELHRDLDGNMRDYASIIELAILSNIEYYNSLLIKENISQKDRLIILNKEANKQKQIFNDNLNYNKALEHK